VGLCSEAKVVVLEKKLEFGTIAVGLKQEKVRPLIPHYRQPLPVHYTLDSARITTLPTVSAKGVLTPSHIGHTRHLTAPPPPRATQSIRLKNQGAAPAVVFLDPAVKEYGVTVHPEVCRIAPQETMEVRVALEPPAPKSYQVRVM
jgi:hypothetical protein